MKYCPKCGTQMSDETVLCPQCHPEVNNQEPQISSQTNPPKSTSNKIVPLISINIILSLITLIAVLIMYFNPLSNNALANDNNSNSNNTSTNIYNSTCPASEYGNHNWSTANCSEPSRCYDCGAYKDDTLGHHNFWTSSDGFNKCMHCGILYEVYMDSLDQ